MGVSQHRRAQTHHNEVFVGFRVHLHSNLFLLVLSRECGNEPRDSLKGIHKEWFIGVIPFLIPY